MMNKNFDNVQIYMFLFHIISEGPDHEHETRNRNRPESWRVWLASAGSITVIALCEVFAVLVVPIMQRVFYQHIIQFLIELSRSGYYCMLTHMFCTVLYKNWTYF